MKTIQSKIGRKYGYYRSRKNMFAVRYAPRLAVPLPTRVDLTPMCPPVVDQGNLGSCTANAIAAAYQFERMKAGLLPLTPSRLFIYWTEREMEGDTSQDDGAFGGDGIGSLESVGVCDESIWPYDVAQFAVKPSLDAFASAVPHIVMSRSVVTMLDEIKQALFDVHLVPFGLTIYESFESDAVAANGIVPDPQPNEGVLGGHEIAIVGYDDTTQGFKIRNSWGIGWGLAGYFWASYNYIMSAGSDFEVITQIAPV